MYPESPGIGDIPVATAARPRNIHSDSTLERCQLERNINGRVASRVAPIIWLIVPLSEMWRPVSAKLASQDLKTPRSKSRWSVIERSRLGEADNFLLFAELYQVRRT